MSHKISAASRQPNLPSLDRAGPGESFASRGRRYQWLERSGVATGDSDRVRIAQLFARTLVPQSEVRGARGLVFRAATPEGIPVSDVRWVSWRVPGESAGIWGLYLAARWLTQAPVRPAANDAFVLIAWGDGPVLAWADENPDARRCLRAALHAPPPWLARGMRSRDETFPVQVTTIDAKVPRRSSAIPVAQTRVAVCASSTTPAAREALLDIVQTWRRAHASTG